MSRPRNVDGDSTPMADVYQHGLNANYFRDEQPHSDLLARGRKRKVRERPNEQKWHPRRAQKVVGS